MPNNYSRENFDQASHNLDEVKRNITGEKTIDELRSLIDEKELLEIEKMELYSEAQTEARLINILYDLEGKYPFAEKSGSDIESYVFDYIGRMEDLVENEKLREKITLREKEDLDRFRDEAINILSKDILVEVDFENFTDVIFGLKDLYLSWSQKFGENNIEVQDTTKVKIEEIPVETRSEESLAEITLKSLVYKPGYSYNRYDEYEHERVWRPSQLYVLAEDSSGKEVKVYLDYDLRSLGIKRFTKNTKDVIERHMSGKLRVMKCLNRYGQPYYKLGQDDLVNLVTAINPRLLKDNTQTIEGEFLPEGQWIKGEHSDENSPETKESSNSDPERVAFLRGLNPQQEIITRAFGKEGRYSAFIFQRPNGSEIAVVATEKTDNADYIFNADQPLWLDEAQKTKLELITGSYSSFIRRVIHQGGWQEVLKGYIFGEDN